MRKVDYMGSQPFASKLLFAPPQSDSEDDLEGELSTSSHEMSEDSSERRQRPVTGRTSAVGEAEDSSLQNRGIYV